MTERTAKISTYKTNIRHLLRSGVGSVLGSVAYFQAKTRADAANYGKALADVFTFASTSATDRQKSLIFGAAADLQEFGALSKNTRNQYIAGGYYRAPKLAKIG